MCIPWQEKTLIQQFILHIRRFSVNAWTGIIRAYIFGHINYRNVWLRMSSSISLRSCCQCYLKMDQNDINCSLCTIVHQPILYIQRGNIWMMCIPISGYRGGPIAWPPPRSPALNPLDFYIWGHLKTLGYATEVLRRDELWPQVHDNCKQNRNSPSMLEHIRQSMVRHDEACNMAEGWTFEHLL